MIYITGDCHSCFTRFDEKNFDYAGCTPENTYIIICGDFGGIFDSKPSEKEHEHEKIWLNWLGKHPVTFVIVGGNHENWDAIESNYEIERWHGGKVRKIRDNIIWVERGEIVEIEGKKFWCFGGAESTDQAYRTPGESWWYREEASPAEFEYGYKNFEDNIDEIDYIISHAAPAQVANFMPGCRGSSETEKFLNRIWWLNREKMIPHFCGHLHHNFHYDLNGYDVTILYEDIISLEE